MKTITKKCGCVITEDDKGKASYAKICPGSALRFSGMPKIMQDMAMASGVLPHASEEIIAQGVVEAKALQAKSREESNKQIEYLRGVLYSRLSQIGSDKMELFRIRGERGNETDFADMIAQLTGETDMVRAIISRIDEEQKAINGKEDEDDGDTVVEEETPSPRDTSLDDESPSAL